MSRRTIRPTSNMWLRPIRCVCGIMLLALVGVATPAYAVPNYALEFDGVNDYIDVPTTAYAFEDGSTFTIELWGKWFDDIRSVCVRRYSLQRSRFRTRGTASLSVNTGISNADWNHVAITYDGSGDTKTLTVYVNGVQSGSTTTTSSPLSSYQADTLRLGMTHHSSGQYSHCVLDEIRMWNIVRPLSAIQADMGRGLTGAEAGLIGYWPINEGQGTVVTDLSPSGNHGTLVDGAWTTEAPSVAPGPAPARASEPFPANEADDVPRDVVLSWRPGGTARTHDVYLGTSLSAVTEASRANPLDVLVGRAQDSNSYDPPERLEFGTGYYWRVDEVNAPPDSTVTKGKIWSFATEPIVYQMTNIIVTASSSAAGVIAENTINGSGLNDSDQHDMTDAAMWVSDAAGPQPTWIKYEFDRAYKMSEMWVWNYNVMFEGVLGFGFKDVKIDYSVNGDDWTTLSEQQFARGAAANTYEHNITVNFGGVAAKYIRLTASSNWGGLAQQFGLAEVRFYYVPAHPRQPIPATGETGVNPGITLSWRAGREAASHEVYFSEDRQAVDGLTAPVATVTRSSYDCGPLSLGLGKTYYWKVVEGNDTATPDSWEGDTWSFTTLDAFAIDDFESYSNDSPNRVFQKWIDGLGFSPDTFFPKGGEGNGTGAMVGYNPAERNIMESTVVHGGRQSMPLMYDNTQSPYCSEAIRTWDTPQNWTLCGADTLRLFIRGNPVRFVESAQGVITMSAKGVDIFDVADECTFACKQLTGNGSVVVRVDSVEFTNVWSKGGVMIRDGLEASAKNAFAYVTPDGRVGWSHRRLAGDVTENTRSEPNAVTAPHWVRLTRDGSTITAAHSSDGAAWEPMIDTSSPAEPSFATLPMGSTVYVGLALTSHLAGVGCTAQFSDCQTPGASGAWQLEEIGIDHQLNDSDSLYVVLEDSGGHSLVVPHTNPDAVLDDTWQPWNVPLATFRTGGVNTAAITRMTIGVGKRNSATARGAGAIFVDDIGFGRPASAQ